MKSAAAPPNAFDSAFPASPHVAKVFYDGLRVSFVVFDLQSYEPTSFGCLEITTMIVQRAER